jgi:hypothetical protein
MNAFDKHHKDSIQFGYRCFDRLLLSGTMQSFQQPERVLGFFNTYCDGKAAGSPLEPRVPATKSAPARDCGWLKKVEYRPRNFPCKSVCDPARAAEASYILHSAAFARALAGLHQPSCGRASQACGR